MRIDVYHHTVREPGLDAMLLKLTRLFNQGELIMATLVELNQKIADLTTAIADERTEVQGLLDGLRVSIQALQDQLAAGSTVSQADLDALGAALDVVILQVRAISEPAV